MSNTTLRASSRRDIQKPNDEMGKRHFALGLSVGLKFPQLTSASSRVNECVK